MKWTRLLLFLLTLQNILDCNGISLRDQLVRILESRRLQHEHERLKIYIRSQASSEEPEKDKSPDDEIADYPIDIVPHDKPSKRMIKDHFKIAQANAAKKLELDTIIATQRKTRPPVDFLRTIPTHENQLSTFQKSITEMLTTWKADQDLRLNNITEDLRKSIDVLSKKIYDHISNLTCKHKNYNRVVYRPLVSNVSIPHVATKTRQNVVLNKTVAYAKIFQDKTH